MFPYIVVIFLVTFFSFFAQKAIKRSKFFFVFFSILVLLIPSLLAAFRDLNIGVDVLVYEWYVFQQAKCVDTIGTLFSKSELEPFFVLINFFASCVSRHVNIALFLIQFCIVFFAYCAFVRMRNVIPMWIMMLLFMLGLYNISFNLMRQCIAIAYIMFAYTYLLKDGNLFKFILIGSIAIFMHKTAIVPVLGLSFVHWSARRTNKSFYAVLFIIVLVTLLFFLKIALEMLASINPIFEKFVAYGDSEQKGFKPVLFSVLWVGLLLCMVMVVFSKKYKIMDDYTLYCYFLILSIDLSCQFLGLYTGYATRLGMYFSALQVFYMPRFVLTNRFNRKTNTIFRIVVILIFVIVWLKLLRSTGNTIPYSSEILGV